jgi:hypothetical protein
MNQNWYEMGSLSIPNIAFKYPYIPNEDIGGLLPENKALVKVRFCNSPRNKSVATLKKTNGMRSEFILDFIFLR